MSQPTTYFVPSLVLSFLVLLTAGLAAQEQRLTVETATGLREVRSPALSPEATRAAYVLRVPRTLDEEPGGPHNEVWVVGLRDPDGPPRRFTPKGVDSWAPAWAPDGSDLAFLSRRGDATGTQVYFAHPDGGEASVLTDHPTSIRSFAFSPDGGRIAFTAHDAKSEARKEIERQGRDWIVYGEVLGFDRLWVFDRATGETTRVYDVDLHAGRFVWTPDGKTLVFHGAAAPDADTTMMYSKLYRVPAAGGEPKVLFETVGKLGDLEVSPDGKTLAFLGAVDIHDPLAQNVFVGPIEGGEARRVTEAFEEAEPHPYILASSSRGTSVSELVWIDNDTLLVGGTNKTRSALKRLEVETGLVREVVSGGTMRSIALHRASGTFLVTSDSPRHPAELKVGALATGDLQRFTTSNPELDGHVFGRREAIAWRADDDKRIEGILTLPPGHDPAVRYPLVVNPHGGPEGADRDGWSMVAQVFAARDYVVLQPNYRGSAGRGVAFSKGDHFDLGGKEFGDVLFGIDLLVGKGLVDPARVGIAGWSYGGYFAALGATHHSDRFQAAVVGAGITNWVSFLGTTDIPHENYLVHWECELEGNEPLMWMRSPLSGLAKAGIPTLFLHGAEDRRVPPSQAMELHRALKDKGVTTELVLYPRSGHGPRERAQRIDLFTREVEWFDRYLK